MGLDNDGLDSRQAEIPKSHKHRIDHGKPDRRRHNGVSDTDIYCRDSRRTGARNIGHYWHRRSAP